MINKRSKVPLWIKLTARFVAGSFFFGLLIIMIALFRWAWFFGGVISP